MTTYLLTLELSRNEEEIIDFLRNSPPDGDDWPAYYNDLFDSRAESMIEHLVEYAKPLAETSFISWLPTDGFAPPVTNQRYFVKDLTEICLAVMKTEGLWLTEGGMIVYPTHFAVIPQP